MNSNHSSSIAEIDDEDEHFYLAGSLITWMERCRSMGDENPQESLAQILPTPSSPTSSFASDMETKSSPSKVRQRLSSATGIAWSLVRIFTEKHQSESFKDLINTHLDKYSFDLTSDTDDFQLHVNDKIEFVKAGSQLEGNECSDVAHTKLVATFDDRKIECIEDGRRHCQELVNELLLMPKNRILQSTALIEENVKRLVSDPERAKVVIEALLPWLSEPVHHIQKNGSNYVANHLLKTTLEFLLATNLDDTYNSVIIDVCLAHPRSVQLLSPHLSPSACSISHFLELYVLICSKQSVLSPMATFVLLSKFDLHSYLEKNTISKEDHHQLIRTTCAALREAGANQADSYELTFDLFKRHLQIELTSPSQRQPVEFIVALVEFLQAMNERALTPNLWLDYLTIMGLEVNHMRKTARREQSPSKMIDESQITLEGIAEDVARMAETQMIFDHEASSTFMQTISEYMRQAHESTSVTLLELHLDYLEQFGMVMLSATFMWLKWVCRPHSDNHELAWKRFIDLWRHWILLAKNCKNVSKSTYTLAASFFVVSLRYMIHKSPQNTCAILQSLLFELTNHVAQTREESQLQLTILQSYLKALPWSSLIATPSDIGNLAALSEQDNHNLSTLVSHVLSEMNTKESLSRIQQSEPSSLPHVVERLATMIVLHSGLLRGYKLHSRYFSQLPVDDIPRLAELILARAEFNNLENSTSNKLLFKLLRYTCFDPSMVNSANSNDGSLANDSRLVTSATLAQKFERAVIYARFISNYLVDLIRRHPVVINHNKKYLHTVINNSLIDLEPILSSQEVDMGQKTILYASLLKCCSCDALESNSRLLLARSVVESHMLRNKPKLVVELVQAISQFLKDGRILVLMIENLVDLYRNINGHYEKVWSNFNLRSIADELYLSTCVDERAPLAMMIYFESLFHSNQQPTSFNDHAVTSTPYQSHHQRPLTTNQIWSRFFQWLARLTQSLCSLRSSDQVDGSKLTSAWVRVLELFETDMRQYLIGEANCDAECSGSSHGSDTHRIVDMDAQEKFTGCSSDNELAKSPDLKSSAEKSPTESTRLRTPRRTLQAKASSLRAEDEFLLSFIKQLVSFYDSINSSGLWSYLKSSTKSEDSCKVSVTALATACFMAHRALTHLNDLSVSGAGANDSASSLQAQRVLLRDELTKLLRVSLSRLEAARRSKRLADSSQFVETLIESVQHEKVQYSEGVQLIKTYARAH